MASWRARWRLKSPASWLFTQPKISELRLPYLCAENSPVTDEFSAQWRNNERDGISNHQPHACLLNWKYQSSASLAFVQRIHRWPVNSSHKGPVMRKIFPFDDVIMKRKCSNVDYFVTIGCTWGGHAQMIGMHDFVHYGDVIMGAIAFQITSLTIVYSTVDPDAHQRKLQSSASLFFVRGIHRGPVNSPHKWPITRKMFPFDDVFDVYLRMHLWNIHEGFNYAWYSLMPAHKVKYHRLWSQNGSKPLQWRHNGCDSVSNHKPHDC